MEEFGTMEDFDEMRLPAFHKPFMFIGGMVHHQIHDDADASFMGGRQHLVEVLHRAEFFHERLIADLQDEGNA